MKSMMKPYFLASLFALVLIAGTVPFATRALEQSDNTAQINALVARIAELQAMLANLKGSSDNASVSTQGGATGTQSCVTLTSNLGRGMADASTDGEVTTLQQFLISQGLLSSDSATGYFGPLTMAAVQEWQAANGIVSSGTPESTGYGRVGPATRQAMACSTEDDIFLDDIFLDDLLEESAADIPMDDSIILNYQPDATPIAYSPNASQVGAVGAVAVLERETPPTLGSFNTPPYGYAGNVRADGNANGWAYDPDEPKTAISVHAYIDGKAGVGTFIGAAKADKNRKDITEGKTSYNHWYSFSIPEEYKDGKAHTIYTYGIDSKGLTAKNNALLKNNPKTFTLVAPPPLPQPSCTLTASPDSITPGNASTLSWTTKDATTGRINKGVGAITPIAAGSKSDSPATTTTYTATVTGAGGSATCEASVDVTTGGDTTRPTVSLTAPAASSTVSGNVTLSANASDNIGVLGVQFKVDNKNVGAEDTTAPYSQAWNSTTVGNGTHNIRAVARDAAGNTRWSAVRSVTVSNTTTSVPRSVIHDPTYQSGFSVRSPESVLSYTTSQLYPFGNNNNSKTEWSVGQWGSQYPFSSTTPKTVLANGAVEYKTPGKRIVLGPGNYVLLGLNSIDWGSHIQRLGTNSKVKGFISMVPEKHNEDLIPISQLESVQYKMSFRLVKAEQGGPGSGGAHAQANLRLTNKNPSSPGYGEWVYFIIKLYDNRYRTISYQLKKDGGTGALLYRLPSSDFYGNQSAWDMQWITIDKDILPMFAKAIQTGYSKGYLKSNNLDDYVPTFTGVHWEMTALKSVEMEFKDYDMILTPKPGVVLGASTTREDAIIESIRASLSNALVMLSAVLQSLQTAE